MVIERKSHVVLMVILSLASWSCRAVPGQTGSGQGISAADMRARISFLASDQLRGRGTPSRGLEMAADYIATEFARFGLEAPAGGYVQEYRIGWTGMGPMTAQNVVAIARGSDLRLSDEYVLLSAHMDHLGVGAPLNGDSIYNGADDNASGTAGIVEVAEAVAALETKPRRSVIFATLSGEEHGLLGSSWFVEHPPVPLERIVANVNVDMIGRNWEDTISVIGKPYSTLGFMVDSVAAAHPDLGLAVVGDLWPAEGFFFRSDHFNFARKGIPAVFFFNGVHEDYHKPSDEVEKIKFDKAARVAELVYELTLALANAEGRPNWDPRVRDRIVGGR